MPVISLQGGETPRPRLGRRRFLLAGRYEAIASLRHAGFEQLLLPPLPREAVHVARPPAAEIVVQGSGALLAEREVPFRMVAGARLTIGTIDVPLLLRHIRILPRSGLRAAADRHRGRQQGAARF